VGSIVASHIQSTKGRISELVRERYLRAGIMNEKEIENEVKDWLKRLQTVFPRKQYNGVEQVCITSSQVLGFVYEKSRALGMKNITLRVVKQLINVHPYLIGLRRGNKPVTETMYVEDTVVSASKDRRTAIKVYEVLEPPFETERFYVETHDSITIDQLREIFAFGRIGSSRKQGYGSFRGRVVGVLEDGGGS